MKRLQKPRHYNPTAKGKSDAILYSHALKHNLTIVIDNYEDNNAIISITDHKTGLHRKFLFNHETDLINGMIINHNTYLMLMEYLVSHGLIMTRYKKQMIVLEREYPNMKPIDRHKLCVQNLKEATLTA